MTTFKRGGRGYVAPETRKPTPSGYKVGKGGAAAFRAKQEASRAASIKKYGSKSVHYKLAMEKLTKTGAPVSAVEKAAIEDVLRKEAEAKARVEAKKKPKEVVERREVKKEVTPRRMPEEPIFRAAPKITKEQVILQKAREKIGYDIPGRVAYSALLVPYSIIRHPIKTAKAMVSPKAWYEFGKEAVAETKKLPKGEVSPEFMGSLIGMWVTGKAGGKVVGKVAPPVKMKLGKISPRYKKVPTTVFLKRVTATEILKKPSKAPAYHVATPKELFPEIAKGEFIVKPVKKGLGAERLAFERKAKVKARGLYVQPEKPAVGFGLQKVKYLGEPLAALEIVKPIYATYPKRILKMRPGIAKRAAMERYAAKRPGKFFPGAKAAAGMGFEYEYVVKPPTKFKVVQPYPTVLRRAKKFTYYEPAYARVELIETLGRKIKPAKPKPFKVRVKEYAKRVKTEILPKKKKLPKKEVEVVRRIRKEIPIKERKVPILRARKVPAITRKAPMLIRAREIVKPRKRAAVPKPRELKVPPPTRRITPPPEIRRFVPSPRKYKVPPPREFKVPPPEYFRPTPKKLIPRFTKKITKKKKLKKRKEYFPEFEYRPSLKSIELPRVKKLPKKKVWIGVEERPIKLKPVKL